MTPLHLLSLRFTALGVIRQLPPFHGPHWSALFRNLLRPHLVGADADGLWVIPAPDSPPVYERGDSISLGLAFPPELTGAMSAALFAFNAAKTGSGHFQPEVTVRLDKILCRISGATWNPFAPRLLSGELLQAEIERLCQIDRFTLRIETPLRLTRPAGEKESGHRYCDAAYFLDGGITGSCKIAALLDRVRHYSDALQMSSPLQVSDIKLDWQDTFYGSGFSKSIGGIIGEISVAGQCGREAATRLVAGQYLGAGKNAAFGFGFYTIPELDPVRRIAPLGERLTVTLADPDSSIWADDAGLVIARSAAVRETIPWENIGRIVIDPDYPLPAGVMSRIMREGILFSFGEDGE